MAFSRSENFQCIRAIRVKETPHPAELAKREQESRTLRGVFRPIREIRGKKSAAAWTRRAAGEQTSHYALSYKNYL